MKEDKYILIAAPNLSDLQTQVNGAIALGYYPMGNLVQDTEEYETTWVQPMIMIGVVCDD
jgi:hypothetical protein